MRSNKAKHVLLKIFVYLFLLVVSMFMILPLLWMFASAFKPMSEIFSYPVTLIPKHPTLKNFIDLFTQHPFGRNLLNSTIISSSYTVLSLFFCSLAGFAFAKYEFKWKKSLFLFLLGTMLIPFQVTMIPLYVLYRNIGWINTYWGLIFPGMANAFGIFFMRQYITKIPNELIDAAKVDGATDFKIFLTIIMPLSIPALTSLGIILFMGSWNNYLWPLIILQSEDMYTAPVALSALNSGAALYTPYGLILAGASVTVLPLIIILLVFQRYFISGIMGGALKG